MRAALGLISLLLVLALVGLLTRKSLPTPGVAPAPSGMPAPVATPAQAQQVQEQYRKALDQALQQARPASAEY